jgi:hypothetical protein
MRDILFIYKKSRLFKKWIPRRLYVEEILIIETSLKTKSSVYILKRLDEVYPKSIALTVETTDQISKLPPPRYPYKGAIQEIFENF